MTTAGVLLGQALSIATYKSDCPYTGDGQKSDAKPTNPLGYKGPCAYLEYEFISVMYLMCFELDTIYIKK